MYDIPEGFIEKAIGEVRETFFFDRNLGKYHPAEHYSIIFAESIWHSYVLWKNQDSAGYDHRAPTVRDIEYGCRKNGIPCRYDRDDLVVSMKNMQYLFNHSWFFCYGGPVGDEMEYVINDRVDLKCSIKALLRLLKWFDNAIPKVMDGVEEMVDTFARQFKRALILQAGSGQILEPGLEDVEYRYSFRSDDEDHLDIWIYYMNEDGTRLDNLIMLSFPYEEYARDPQFIKSIVMRLAQDEEYIGSYSRWVKDFWKTKDSFPLPSSVKNAGVCVWHKI